MAAQNLNDDFAANNPRRTLFSTPTDVSGSGCGGVTSDLKSKSAEEKNGKSILSRDQLEKGDGKSNRKKISEEKLKKMNPVQRSRYTAYEEPKKAVAEKQAAAKKRLQDQKKVHAMMNQDPTDEEKLEKEQHAKLIGQLKAAEARNRIRIMRLRYQANKAQEISHLISCQPSALNAVRLQALLPTKPEHQEKDDTLERLARDKVEALLNDEEGLMTQRITS